LFPRRSTERIEKRREEKRREEKRREEKRREEKRREDGEEKNHPRVPCLLRGARRLRFMDLLLREIAWEELLAFLGGGERSEKGLRLRLRLGSRRISLMRFGRRCLSLVCILQERERSAKVARRVASLIASQGGEGREGERRGKVKLFSHHLHLHYFVCHRHHASSPLPQPHGDRKARTRPQKARKHQSKTTVKDLKLIGGVSMFRVSIF